MQFTLALTISNWEIGKKTGRLLSAWVLSVYNDIIMVHVFAHKVCAKGGETSLSKALV
jgi:hypothetical protein